MTVITVSNIKGGVAKTTTAQNMSAGLHKRGYRVLMIDADPQMNLTTAFFDEEDYVTTNIHDDNNDGELIEYKLTDFRITEEERKKIRTSIAKKKKEEKILMEEAEHLPTLRDVFDGNLSLEEAIRPIEDGFDMVTGDFDLCSADMDYLMEAGSTNILANEVSLLSDRYDFVIIDTPPNMGFLSISAFYSSDYVVTPMLADSFSYKAAHLLSETLFKVALDRGRRLPVLGTLLTKYNGSLVITKVLEGTLNEASRRLRTEMFETKVRQAIAISECQTAKMDIFSYAPDSKVASDYDDFITELLERIGK